MASFRHVNSLRTILSRANTLDQKLPRLHAAHNGLHTRPLLSETRGLWLRVCPITLQRLPVATCGVMSIRHNSNVNMKGYIPEAPVADPGYMPDAPPIPIPVAADLTPQLNILGEPTLASQGLAAATPPGLVQSILENIHVMCDVPWWGSIVILTMVVRICVFPLVIYTQRNTTSMNNHMPTIQRLQSKFTAYRSSGNSLDAARTSKELNDYMKRNNVSPMRAVIAPLIQMPIFMSVFFGIRAMTSLPVESMTTGGILWFTNLTLTDPFYLLPIVTSATLALTLELGSDGMKTGTMNPIMKGVLRALPLIMFPVIINFPAAMLVYWMTTNVFSLCQVMFLKIPTIRAYFKIPVMIKHKPTALTNNKGFIQGVKESMSNARLTADVQNRERMDANHFKAAGRGAVQKTYKQNPKITKKS